MELSNSFMKLDINYDKFVDSKQVTVHFCKNNNDSSFSFRQYLIYKKKETDILMSSSGQSEKKYIKYYFDLLKQTIDDDLKDVLSGKTWLDLPADYMGYK